MLRHVALALVITAAACGGSTTKAPAKAAAPSVNSAAAPSAHRGVPVPAAFKFIPADTPYLMAGDMGTPWARRRAALLGYMLQESYRELRTQLPTMDPDERKLFGKFFDLVGKDLDAAALDRMGIPATPVLYVYGIGIMPALRMRLTSGKKLRDTVDAVGAILAAQLNMKVPAPMSMSGVDYWYFPNIAEFPNPKGTKAGLSLAVAIVGDELVAGLVVEALRDDMLPLLLGTRPPARSLASSPHLQNLLRRYRVTPTQLTVLDVEQAARQFLGKATGLSERIAHELRGRVPSPYSPTCRRELMSLASLVPRMVYGTKRSSPDSSQGTFIIELHDDVVHALKSSMADIPGDLSRSDVPLAVGLGIDGEQLGVQLVSAARRIQRAPYGCTQLTGMNNMAAQMAQVPVEPILKRIGSPTGIGLIIQSYREQPFDMVGAVVVAARDPNALWQLIATQVPALSKLTVEVGGAAVAASLSPSGPMAHMHVALTDERLGMSMGRGGQRILVSALDSNRRPDRAVAVMNYDESFTQAQDTQKILAALRLAGLNATAKRVEARIAAETTTTRGQFVMRVGKHGLIGDYTSWEAKR